MANNNAIGLALEIPESVFNQIDRAQKEIVKLEEQARTSADKINKSFRSMGIDGLDYFIKKLKEAQGLLAGFKLGDTNGIGTQIKGIQESAKGAASSIVEVANALNRIGKSDAGAFSGSAPEVQKLSKEVSALSESYAKLKKKYSELEKSKSRGTSSTRAAAQAESVYNRAMFATEGTITQRINKIAKLREAERRLTEAGVATSQRISTIRQEIARLNAENTKAAKSTDTLRKSQKSLLNTADQLKRAIALVFSVSQIRGYVTNLARVRGEFELQNKALAAILQNKDEADRLFNQITELAVRSPFQLKELVTYTKQLSAYRIESDKLFDTTKMLADVSAGLGVEMGRLILAYGQIKAAGYLRGSETRQLTEAGVNVLGELADYYSELEGRIVSVNEVMDRQFKRMISFQDVEQIFKRLTSQGGIFYNMQEIQADTLTGMVSNLRDSIDIMLNEIGKSTEGSMKAAINTVKALVDNYQIVETVLKAVSAGFAVYIARAIAASVANAKLAKSTSAAAARLLEMRKAQGIGTAFEKFGSSISKIKLNPLMVAVTLITGAAVGIAKWNKGVQEAKAEYDTFSKSLIRSKDTLNGLVSGIEKQTKALNEAKAEMSSLEQGTDAYADASDRAAKAEKERNTLLVKLKREFPEVAAGYNEQTDSLDALVAKQKEYNEELRSSLSLNYLMQQEEGWFNEGIIKDYADLSAATKDFEKASQSLGDAYDAINNKIERLLVTNERLNKAYGEEIRGVLEGDMSEYDKLTELYAILNSFSGASGTLPIPSILALAAEIKEVTKESDELKKTYTAAMREAQKETQILVDTALKDANGDVEKAKKTIEMFIRSLPSMVDKTMQEFVNRELELRLGFTIDFDDVPKELDWFQKQIEEYRKDNKLTLVPEVTVDKTHDTYFKSLNDKIKENETEIEKLTIATEQLNETETNEARIEKLKEENRQISQLLKAFGEYKDESGDDDSAMKTLNERINLIKEMNKEYENLLKNYSEEDAAMKVRETFKDTADELGMSSIVATMSFDAQGVLDAFDQLMQGVVNNVEGLSQEQVNKLVFNLKKAIDNYSVTIGIDERIKKNEDISKTIDNLFTAYELTKEMKDLGIDETIAEQLFGFEAMSLDDLRRAIEELRDEVVGTEAMEQYQKALDKMEELEEKMLKERIKQYSEYIKKSISERAALEIAAQKEIAKIQSEDNLSTEVKTVLITNIKEETAKKKAQLDWEDFQESDVYTKMFEDLEYVSTAALQRIKSHLDSIKESVGSAFSPEQMKSFQSAYNQIEEQLISRNPFKSMKEAMKDVKDLQKEGKTEDYLQQQLLAYDAQAAQLKSEISDLELIIGLKENKISLENLDVAFIERNAGLLEQETSLLREQVNLKKQSLSAVNTDIGVTSEQLSSYEKARKSLTQMSSEMNTLRSLGNTAFESIKDILISMGVESDSVGMILADMGMDLLDMVAQAALFGLQLQMMTVQAEMLGVAMNMALGPIGWAVSAIQAITTIVKGITDAVDKTKQNAIDEQLDKIEQLEKAYEKLSKAVEDALSAPDMIGNYEQSLKNINDQIDSYRQSIAIEKSRKNPDEENLQEWEDSIEDLYEQQQELYETMISNLGGFGSQENMRSAAQEFADAWLDAYKETGDGLSALMDKWDEYFDNIVAQQLMLRGTQMFLEPVMSQIDKMIEDGTFTADEYKDIQERIDEVMPQLNEFWKSIADSFDLNTDSGEMSGLQKGIQSITETTAQALEALLNSVRFFVADSNTQLHTLVNTLTATDGYPNPMLDELRNQTRIMTSIQNMLSSVVKAGHPQGGYGIKTFMD